MKRVKRDLVLAAEEATFVQVFAKIGLVPDTGGSFFLPRLVGLARATALAMLAEKITAAQAVDIGLIYRACPAASLDEEASKLADIATEVEVARLLMLRAAALKDSGRPAMHAAAMAKLFASETAMRAATSTLTVPRSCKSRA